MSDIRVSVQKFDPSRDKEPYLISYDIPWKEHLTALEAIHYINENCEPIIFDYSCRGNLCGRCAVTVDGKASLACFTPLTEQEHTITPLKGFPIIRDLVVDRAEFTESIGKIGLAVQTTKDTDAGALPILDYDFWYNTLFKLDLCRECGNCMTVCPVLAEKPLDFAGPARLSQLGLRMFDQLDQANRALQAYTMGVHDCIRCGLCESVCPAHIPHAELHGLMQEEAARNGFGPKE